MLSGPNLLHNRETLQACSSPNPLNASLPCTLASKLAVAQRDVDYSRELGERLWPCRCTLCVDFTVAQRQLPQALQELQAGRKVSSQNHTCSVVCTRPATDTCSLLSSRVVERGGIGTRDHLSRLGRVLGVRAPYPQSSQACHESESN